MTQDYYRHPEIAESYDAEQLGRAITVEDIPFYVELAKETGAMGEGVLELGCGTGRVTIPIAEASVEIVGLDSAPEMLAVAKHKTPDARNPTWVEANMANFNLGRQFGLVIIPFRSFLMLLSIEDQKSCLACAREHLLDGGRLALNFFNPDLRLLAAWQGRGRQRWQRERTSGDQEVWSQRRASTSQQTVQGTDRYVQSSSEGAVIARVERNLRIRYVFRYEMEHLLALSGFEVEALYGWFDGRPFDDQSSEMVWIALKTLI